jgi:hypothetical protein
MYTNIDCCCLVAFCTWGLTPQVYNETGTILPYVAGTLGVWTVSTAAPSATIDQIYTITNCCLHLCHFLHLDPYHKCVHWIPIGYPLDPSSSTTLGSQCLTVGRQHWVEAPLAGRKSPRHMVLSISLGSRNQLPTTTVPGGSATWTMMTPAGRQFRQRVAAPQNPQSK